MSNVTSFSSAPSPPQSISPSSFVCPPSPQSIVSPLPPQSIPAESSSPASPQSTLSDPAFVMETISLPQSICGRIGKTKTKSQKYAHATIFLNKKIRI